MTDTFNLRRRTFIGATASAFAGLLASCSHPASLRTGAATGLGPLVADPAGILDLPEGFTYRVLSRLGDRMSDGFAVPDHADGMGCFDLGNGRLALVRNHELRPPQDNGGVVGAAFDTVARSLVPLPGGTTTIVLDAETLAVERQFRSLAGTIRNCAGGITPWGSWLTCEEDVSRADGRINRDHGWVFEVPAAAAGLVEPRPLTAMGRFNHEAACVDPATGIVYLTEDRNDGLLYRFIPHRPGRLAEGGVLQALALEGLADTRGWESPGPAAGSWLGASWLTLEDVEAPQDDLRLRGARAGAAIFARGEGIWMGEGELYFTCTSGGGARQGQIFRLVPRPSGPDALQLFYESSAAEEYGSGDNLTIAPNGHLIVCEDRYGGEIKNHLRGVTPQGLAYPLARLQLETELAGACFSPDGQTLFVNVFSPAMTLAIRGPWLA